MKKLFANGNEKGFTLIELMIVIAIIGVLAAIAIPNFISYRAKSYCSRSETDAHNILGALSSYYSEAQRTGVPTVTELIQNAKLAITNTGSKVTGSANGVITITVPDNSKICPLGSAGAKKYKLVMGSNGYKPGWTN